MLEPILMTRTEAQYVTLLFYGMTARQIAAYEHVSLQVVKNGLSSVYAKAGARSATDLVRLAFHNGGFLY